MNATITVEYAVPHSPRVAQVRGIFDLPPTPTSRLTWEVRLPLEERPWSVGLITGPSGCGKSTIARRLWPEETARAAGLTWPADRSVLDAFPRHLGIKDVTTLLCAVGFSSPPAWLRPFHVLSTGQRFRVTLARLLAGPEQDEPAGSLVVLDEFSSTVDRTVAQIGSAALAKTVRARGQRFIAVSCHDDVVDWLQPDWVYLPAEDHFAWRSLQRRPSVRLDVVRCQASAWTLFKQHHYLADALNPSAICFLATWRGRPVVFSAWLPFFGRRRSRREHRTVTLPDYQGIGLGNAVSDHLASLWKGLGLEATSTTTHPAMIRSRLASPHWVLTRRPSVARGPEGKVRHAVSRLTAGFRYVGPAMPREQARRLLS
jgi:ABC-type ATPase involved in cell division